MRWIIIAVVAATGIGVWFWLDHRPQGPVYWQGYAEGDYVKIGPTQQGLLTTVSVQRGDEVAAGAPLFTQDATSDKAAREQAARLLAQAQDQLANLQASGKPTEIEQARANLADAQAAADRAQSDLKRAQALLPQGAGTQESVDQLQTTYRSAAAHVQVMQAALDETLAPMGRDEEIQAQNAAVAAAEAAVEMADWRLAQRTVTAPQAGRIADVIALPGETVDAGMPVVSLLPPQNIFFRFFVPEGALASMHRDQKVGVTCDGCPAGMTAQISFISPQAEYTPPVIYSEASNSKLVYLVEAHPDIATASKINPGQPVEVRPLPDAAP